MGSSPTDAASTAFTSLSRLANDSGGRFTEHSNDLSLAYARAQRDLACTYSIGFYVRGVEEDEIEKVSIRVKRDGLRAVHPGKYVFRSPQVKRESLLRAAFLSPELFETGVVRAHVFPIRPTERRTWEGLLAVSFPVPLAGTAGGEARREFGAVLHDGPRLAHRFSRRIALQPDHAEVTSEPLITFLEPVDLKPGTYELSVVLSDPAAPEPHAAKVDVEVPEVPKKELFLVGPILGRPAGTNLVVTAGRFAGAQDELGAANSFEPLLVQQLDEPVDLVALTQACYVGKKLKTRDAPAVARSLRRSDGTAIGELTAVELELDGDDRVLCQNLVDVLPSGSLADGEYVFEASLAPGREGETRREKVRFAVGRSTLTPRPAKESP